MLPTVVSADGKVQIQHLYHPLTRHDFLRRSQSGPLWAIELREPSRGQETSVHLDSTQARSAVIKDSAGSILCRFSGFDLGEERDVIEVTVTVQQESPSIPRFTCAQWQIAVQNRSTRYGLWQVIFPILSHLGASAEAELLLPLGWGVLHRDPTKADLRLPRGWEMADKDPSKPGAFTVDYPHAFCTMQFAALGEGESGLYLATHDRKGYHKRFHFAPFPFEERLAFQITHYPEGMGTAGKDFQLPYPVVVGAFMGGWIDAAKIYREWAKAHSIWFPRQTVKDSQTPPPWFREIALWCKAGLEGNRVGGGEAASVVPGVLRFADYFKVPIAVHWYGWHQIPFDDSYPEYLPPKEGFKEGVAQLQEAGVRVIPYINGRLFDPRTDSWKNEGAAAFCALNPRGEKYVEVYGQSPPLTPMCPKTPYWQEKVASIVERLVDEYGVDGVYIDQIGAAPAKLCFNPSHPHPLGGGHYWVEGYREMLEKVRSRVRRKNPAAVLVTEDAAEPYTGLLDGYLMCNQTLEAMVPAYPAVYGGVNLTFGRRILPEDAQERWPFVVKIAQMFVFGAQMGWLGPWILDFPQAAEYLKVLAQVRFRGVKYLAGGELVHPPSLDVSNLSLISTQWRLWNKTQRVDVPAVLCSAWRAQDGALGIVTTNLSETSQAFRWALDPSVHAIARAARGWQIDRIGPEGVESRRALGAGDRLAGEEILPPRYACVLEVQRRDALPL